jgi:hypothetical protein
LKKTLHRKERGLVEWLKVKSLSSKPQYCKKKKKKKSLVLDSDVCCANQPTTTHAELKVGEQQGTLKGRIWVPFIFSSPGLSVAFGTS